MRGKLHASPVGTGMLEISKTLSEIEGKIIER